MDRKRKSLGWLLVVGLGAALLGQFFFFYRRGSPGVGAFFWCVAILSFASLLWLERAEQWQPASSPWRRETLAVLSASMLRLRESRGVVAPTWLKAWFKSTAVRARVSRCCLIGGLGAAFLGQFYFFYRRESVLAGAFLWCLAILSFALLLWVDGLGSGGAGGGSNDMTQESRLNSGGEGQSQEAIGQSSVEPQPVAHPEKETIVEDQEEPSGAPRHKSGLLAAIRSGRRAAAILVIGLLLATLAQVALSSRSRFAWVGFIGYVAALILFAGGLAHRVVYRVGRPAWRFLGMALAAGLVVGAAYLAHVRPLDECNYEYALLFWMLGIAFAVLSLLAFRGGKVLRSNALPRKASSRAWWREAAVVGGLFAVALALRLVGLAQFPDVMSGDEGSMALEAQKVLDGNLINPFGTGWLSHHNLFFYLEAVALQVWGWNLFGLRFTAALLGALGVPAVYLLARNVFGRPTAWISAAFAAGWGLPLHFGRLALNNSADVLFGALTLACLQRGLVRGRRADFIVAGLSLGASQYFYHGTRLLIPLVLVTLFLSGTERLSRRWRGLLSFTVVALLVCGPLLVHFVRQPDVFMSRPVAVNLHQARQLELDRQSSGQSESQVLLQYGLEAMLAFVFTPDYGYFYRPATPMLLAFSGALFVLGLGLALLRWQEVRYQVLLTWIGLTVVFAGWLLRSPPHYQRYLIATPAVCLLVAQAAVVALRRMARLWRWSAAVHQRWVVLVAVALLVINAGYYFGVYAPSGAFRWDRNTEIADHTARLMADLGPDYTTYFFGTSHMPLGGFNSVPFLAPDADWMDVLTSPQAGWGFVKAGRPALFVVIPARAGDLVLLRERFPGGREEQVLGRDGGVLFTAYKVEREL